MSPSRMQFTCLVNDTGFGVGSFGFESYLLCDLGQITEPHFTHPRKEANDPIPKGCLKTE